MAKKRKSETAPAASPLVRTGSGLADSGEAVSGMAPTSRPYYESKFALNELPTEMPTDGKELKRADGTPYVQLLDAGDTKCLPVVSACATSSSARWLDIITRRSRRASTRP